MSAGCRTRKSSTAWRSRRRIIHVGGDLSGTTADMTPAELYAYVSANPTHRVYAQLSFQGEHFLMLYQGATNGILTFSSARRPIPSGTRSAPSSFRRKRPATVPGCPGQDRADDAEHRTRLALPNPKALTIRIGGTTVMYDGSTAQTVTIADGTEVSY